MKIKNIAIILAGGTGSRIKETPLPKQYIHLLGKTIIEYSLDVFNSHEEIDEIAIVAHHDFHELLQEIIAKKSFLKVKRIINSGKTRIFSTLAAIKSYSEHEECNLLFHDAARPFINHEIIERCLTALKKYKAVSVAVPVVDAILEKDQNNNINYIPQKFSLSNVQTPQGFRLSVIKSAYSYLQKDDTFSEDCSIVKKYLPDIDIHIVDGSNRNFKITYLEDLLIAETLLKNREN